MHDLGISEPLCSDQLDNSIISTISGMASLLSDLNFAEKRKFLRWSWMASGDLPLEEGILCNLAIKITSTYI